MAFAAEVSRKEGTIVDIDSFKEKILQKGRQDE